MTSASCNCLCTKLSLRLAEWHVMKLVVPRTGRVAGLSALGVLTMFHRLWSALLLDLVLLASCSLLGACEKKCPPGTALVAGQSCNPVNGGNNQNVTGEVVAGSDAPQATPSTPEAAVNTAVPPVAAKRAATNTATPMAEMQMPGVPVTPQSPQRMNMPVETDAGQAPSTAVDMEPVAVCAPSELRCNPSTPGTLDTCEAGQWASQPCAAEEMCLDATDGARCVLPVEACVGREGENVCTETGEMLACLVGGEAMTVASCADSALCKAGIANGRCAECIPGAHQCKGAELETCDPEGQGFVSQESCGSAALCDETKGRCIAPTCEANEYVCEGNALKHCSTDLTKLETTRQCGPGLCDAANQTCRMCMPGQTRCSGRMRQECDAEGRSFAAAACPDDNPICFGNGECAQCAAPTDCEPRACHTVSCGSRRCSYTPTPKGNTASCKFRDGDKVRPGGTTGAGAIYVIAGGAAFHIFTGPELTNHFGGLAGVIDDPSPNALSGCGKVPANGTNIQQAGDDRIGHMAGGKWHHIVHGEDLTNNCGGLISVRKIPSDGLMRNSIAIGESF